MSRVAHNLKTNEGLLRLGEVLLVARIRSITGFKFILFDVIEYPKFVLRLTFASMSALSFQ